jgi:hypothetical protein
MKEIGHSAIRKDQAHTYSVGLLNNFGHALLDVVKFFLQFLVDRVKRDAFCLQVVYCFAHFGILSQVFVVLLQSLQG